MLSYLLLVDSKWRRSCITYYYVYLKTLLGVKRLLWQNGSQELFQLKLHYHHIFFCYISRTDARLAYHKLWRFQKCCYITVQNTPKVFNISFTSDRMDKSTLELTGIMEPELVFSVKEPEMCRVPKRVWLRWSLIFNVTILQSCIMFFCGK